MNKFFLTTIVLLFSFLGIQDQIVAAENRGVKMMSFDEFEPLLYQQNDSIYVVNFWATWCAPCVREIPAFEALNEKYKDQKVKVLLVSLDFPNQLESRVIPFVERMKMKSEVLLLNDPNSNRWIPLVSEEWTGAIPATVIYSKDFRGFYEQEFHFEELEEIIKPLLN
jgi:thiol-disulfide isomerase/thioredoxin